MIPLIIALTSAALFLGLSIVTYGQSVLDESAWVAVVFFGLIASGIVVALAGRPTPRWLRRLGGRRFEMTGGDCAPYSR